jgi:hypothetical protein
MGLQELVETMAKKESFEQGAQEERTKMIRKVARKMLFKENSIEDIIDILECSEEEVLEIQLEYQIETLLQEGQSINEIMTKLEVEEIAILEVIQKLEE